MKIVAVMCVVFGGIYAEATNLRTLLESSGAPAGAYTLVARFPEQIAAEFETDKKCNPKFLRELPSLCRRALTPSSNAEEVLACSLVTAPTDQSKFPLGMYSSGTPLTTALKNLASSSLTPIFNECAVASMINDACLSMTIDDYDFDQTTYNYRDIHTFASTLSNDLGIKAGLDASYTDIFAVKGSYTRNDVQSSSNIATQIRAATGNRAEQRLGTLVNSCIDSPEIVNYMVPSYIQQWHTFGNVSSVQTARQLVNDPSFKSFVGNGLVIPAAFTLGVYYQEETSFDYTAGNSTVSSNVNQAIVASLNISYGGVKVHADADVRTKVQSSLDESHMRSVATTHNEEYGPCDFREEIERNNNLRECAEGVLNHWDKLTRPMRVAAGGFVGVGRIMEKLGHKSSASLVGALNEYYQSCTCDDPFTEQQGQGTHAYTCFSGDGQTQWKGNADSACVSSLWFPYMNNPTFEVQEFHFI